MCCYCATVVTIDVVNVVDVNSLLLSFCLPRQYGTVWRYQLGSVVDTFLVPNLTTSATIYIKCLHRITWGVGHHHPNQQPRPPVVSTQPEEDRLNGQKYLAYISDFKTNSRRKSASKLL